VWESVDAAAEWAEARPLPDPATVEDHLYGSAHASPQAGFVEPEHTGKKIVMVDAINLRPRGKCSATP
jgi:hypothetical protein